MAIPVLWWTTIALGSGLTILVLSQFTRRAASHRAAFEAYLAQTSPDPPRVVTRPVPPLAPVAAERTAAYHWGRLVNHGLLGMLYLSVLPAGGYLNSLILAESFEILLDRLPRTVAEIPLTLPLVGPVVATVTDFLLYGAALTLAQILLGASVGEDWERSGRRKWLALVLGLVPFILFVCSTSAGRGYLVSVEEQARLSPVLNAGLSGLQAYCLGTVDLLAGRWVIHECLLPMLRGACWALVTPPRAVARWWQGRQLIRAMDREWRSVLVVDVRAPRRPGPITRVAGILDGVFAPLRTLDETVARLLRGFGASAPDPVHHR